MAAVARYFDTLVASSERCFASSEFHTSRNYKLKDSCPCAPRSAYPVLLVPLQNKQFAQETRIHFAFSPIRNWNSPGLFKKFFNDFRCKASACRFRSVQSFYGSTLADYKSEPSSSLSEPFNI